MHRFCFPPTCAYIYLSLIDPPRIVYHMYIHCIQEAYMTSTAGMQLSFSELAVPLPESRELWLAQSADQWKDVFLRLQPDCFSRAPSALECVADPSKTRLLPEIYDSEFAQLAQVYIVSTLVREFKQTQCIFAVKDSSLTKETVIADESQEKRLAQILYGIRVGHESSTSNQSVIWNMLRELSSMHLYAFFDQIELFAGREGPEEAQAALPVLSSWIQSQSSRQAAWHAGQVLRYMRATPSSSLTRFHAVVCYHASLCLWIYGTFSKMNVNSSEATAIGAASWSNTVSLDGEETLLTQRWITMNTGTPVISNKLFRSDNPQLGEMLSVNSPQAAMDVMADIVLSKFQSRPGEIPVLVDNICCLMRAIGRLRLQQPAQHDSSVV
jgi:hypothetical protein